MKRPGHHLALLFLCNERREKARASARNIFLQYSDPFWGLLTRPNELVREALHSHG